MSHLMTKPTKWLRPAKTQISLGIAVGSMGSRGPKLSSCGQRRLWSDWADTQADLCLSWAHMLCCFCHEVAQICCWYSLESSQCGNSNEYPQYIFELYRSWLFSWLISFSFSIEYIFYWRNMENYSSIIIKYPLYLFHWPGLPLREVWE